MQENPQGARHTNERIGLMRILMRVCDILTKQSHEVGEILTKQLTDSESSECARYYLNHWTKENFENVRDTNYSVDER